MKRGLVARPTNSDALFADIEHRLADFDLRLIFGSVCKRFPWLKIILGHMGETLPYLLWRLDSHYQLQVSQTLAADERPSAIFRRNFVITTSGVFDPAPLAAAIATVGEDNILFSVDYPYEDPNAAAAFIDNASLSDASRAKICGGNARRVLHLQVKLASARFHRGHAKKDVVSVPTFGLGCDHQFQGSTWPTTVVLCERLPPCCLRARWACR